MFLEILVGLYERVQGIRKVHLTYIFALVKIHNRSYDTPTRLYVSKSEES
eukprot:UN13188